MSNYHILQSELKSRSAIGLITMIYGSWACLKLCCSFCGQSLIGRSTGISYLRPTTVFIRGLSITSSIALSVFHF